MLDQLLEDLRILAALQEEQRALLKQIEYVMAERQSIEREMRATYGVSLDRIAEVPNGCPDSI